MAECRSLIVARVYPWLEDSGPLAHPCFGSSATPPPLRDIPQESIPRLPSVVRSLYARFRTRQTPPFNRSSVKLPPRKYPLNVFFPPPLLPHFPRLFPRAPALSLSLSRTIWRSRFQRSIEISRISMASFPSKSFEVVENENDSTGSILGDDTIETIRLINSPGSENSGIEQSAVR